MKKTVIGILFIAALGVAAYLLVRTTSQPTETPQETLSSPTASPTGGAPPSPSEAVYKTIRAKDIPGASHAFQFSGAIPADWEIEAVPAIEALSIYDPSAAPSFAPSAAQAMEGKEATAGNRATNLERSQIFIRYFRANQFLTLSTVIIHEHREHTIIGRPAVTYLIEKKPGVPNFPNQPSWRNLRHRVTDIRVSDQNPSVFYVIAKRPELPDAMFERFLASLNLNPEAAGLFYPIANFATGVTKKPFGIFVTPENSPVQLERFRGYHTGADIEVPQTDDPIPIFAITDGTVALSQTASGYGGVLAIRHDIGGKKLLAVYGHLKPASMPRAGKEIEADEQIGVLGAGFTAETDFERKHLHFGIYRGNSTNIAGYVQNQNELEQWYDPREFFKIR